MEDFESYKKRITAAMKDCGTYNRNLTIQIENLSMALFTLAKFREVMNDVEFQPFIWKTTKDGKQLIEHPVFKAADRAQNNVNRQMKQLKLTVEDIMGTPDVRDAADDMIDAVNGVV